MEADGKLSRIERLTYCMGERCYFAYLWLIRLNGGLPYSWHRPRGDHARRWCMATWEGPRSVPVLIRRRHLVLWSYFIAMLICSSFMAYMVVILLPRMRGDPSLTSQARILNSLVGSVATMGLVYYLMVSGTQLARMVSHLYVFSSSFYVPFAMEKSRIQLTAVFIIIVSYVCDLGFLVRGFAQVKSVYVILGSVSSVVLRFVSLVSVMPVQLLFHCNSLRIAITYNQVFQSFHHHVSGQQAPEGDADEAHPEQLADSLHKIRQQAYSRREKNRKVLNEYLPATVEDAVMVTASSALHIVHHAQHHQHLFNEYFSVPVLLIMARSITSLIFTFFFVILDLHNRSFSTTMKLLQDASFILVICLAPEAVARQRRKLRGELCRLRVFCSDRLHAKLGRVLELMDDDPNFNVAGYFVVAKSCIIPVTSFISTYLVILIQFHISELQCPTGDARTIANTTDTTTDILYH
ncbi:uncharacterized protein LOC135105429 [Scylla paramamosain]|uniref:uncharacterized protein LOC135105429 n=1 Tax=Scylla paramamosain TaxID=85552 RepID=UPI003082C5EF